MLNTVCSSVIERQDCGSRIAFVPLESWLLRGRGPCDHRIQTKQRIGYLDSPSPPPQGCMAPITSGGKLESRARVAETTITSRGVGQTLTFHPRDVRDGHND